MGVQVSKLTPIFVDNDSGKTNSHSSQESKFNHLIYPFVTMKQCLNIAVVKMLKIYPSKKSSLENSIDLESPWAFPICGLRTRMATLMLLWFIPDVPQ
jgi:hypothetical protein